jgi:hypothetical protein
LPCIGNVETYKIRTVLFCLVITDIVVIIVKLAIDIDIDVDIDIDIDIVIVIDITIAVHKIAALKVLFLLAVIQYVLQESISDSSRIKKIEGKELRKKNQSKVFENCGTYGVLRCGPLNSTLRAHLVYAYFGTWRML